MENCCWGSFMEKKRFGKQLFIHQMKIATDYPIHCFNLLVLRVKTNNNCSGIVQHCMLFGRTSGFFCLVRSFVNNFRTA